jgi:hypothetical protein
MFVPVQLKIPQITKMSREFYRNWSLLPYSYLPQSYWVSSANIVGRDSVVGKATAAGCTVRGSNSDGYKGFFPSPYPPRPALGPTQHPLQGVTGLFPRVKAARFGVGHPHTSTAEVTNERSYSFTPHV